MANVMSDLDRCRKLAASARQRAELVLTTRQPGTRGHYDANAVVEDVAQVEQLLGRIEAGLASKAAAGPTDQPAANGDAAAKPAPGAVIAGVILRNLMGGPCADPNCEMCAEVFGKPKAAAAAG